VGGESGRDGSDEVHWSSRKTYDTWDAARRAAWPRVLSEIEYENDINNWGVIQFDEEGRVIPTWEDDDDGDAA
jgi:hypothetical protein